MNSPRRLARIAGVLYLLVAIVGGFAAGYVAPTMYVAGDATATVANVVGNAGLVRLGVFADLVNQAVLVFLGLTLYTLLRHVHRGAARAMVVLVVAAAAICSVDLSSFGTEGSNAIVLLLLDTQHYGYLVAQIFFGLWLVPLGYLAHKSGWFPKALAISLVVGAGCYLVDLATAFFFSDVNQLIHTFIVIPCVIAEVWMVVYLLVVGVNTNRTDGEDVQPEERLLASA
jgi:hypothetical protein